MPRSIKPPRTGQGALAFGRERHPIAFEIRFLEGAGQRLVRGAITGQAEAMRQAFRAGKVILWLDDGSSSPVTIVAHSEGETTAYFEGVVA